MASSCEREIRADTQLMLLPEGQRVLLARLWGEVPEVPHRQVAMGWVRERFRKETGVTLDVSVVFAGRPTDSPQGKDPTPAKILEMAEELRLSRTRHDSMRGLQKMERIRLELRPCRYLGTVNGRLKGVFEE